MVKNPTDFHSSFGARVGMWYYGFDVIKENPIFGVGTGDHVDAIDAVEKHNPTFHLITHPHNQFVSVFIQFGLIGFLIFLNLFYQIFKSQYASSYQKTTAILTTVAVIMTFMIEGDKVKFFIPLLIVLVSISMASKTIDSISDKDVQKNNFLLYSIVVAIAYAITFTI
jgi:O-antigen ligase